MRMCVAALAGALVVAEAARADVVLSLAWGDDDVSVVPGGKVTVALYLRETVTDGSASLLLAENGVASAGVRVSRQAPGLGEPAATEPATVPSGGVAPNPVPFFDATDPLFGPEIVIVPDRSAATLTVFARDAGVTGSVTGPGVRQILIGFFDFQGGSVAGETSVFRAADPAGSSDTIGWETLAVLDPMILSADISVTVLPSPASGAALLGVSAFASRRRRGAVVPTT